MLAFRKDNYRREGFSDDDFAGTGLYVNLFYMKFTSYTLMTYEIILNPNNK